MSSRKTPLEYAKENAAKKPLAKLRKRGSKNAIEVDIDDVRPSVHVIFKNLRKSSSMRRMSAGSVLGGTARAGDGPDTWDDAG